MKNVNLDRKFFVWFLFLIGFTIFLGIVFGVRPGLDQASPSTAVIAQFALPSDTPTQNDCDRLYIPRMTQLPPAKATFDLEDYHRCQSLLLGTEFPTRIRPTPLPFTPLPPVDTRYRRIAGNGILAFGAMSISNFLGTSEWEEKKGLGVIEVTAGLFLDVGGFDSGRGGVTVAQYDEYRQLISGSGTYLTPQPDGTVTIIDAQGEKLILVSEKGTLFTFDVAARKYIPSIMPMVANKPQRTASQGTIVEDGASPFTSHGYATSNRWYQDLGSRRIIALVGTKKDVPDQGYLILANSPASSDTITDSQAYPVPMQGGSLRIVDARNNQIVVILNGDLPVSRGVYVFDIAGKRFISDQERQALPQDPAVLAYDKVLADHPILPTVTLMPQLIRTTTKMPAYP